MSRRISLRFSSFQPYCPAKHGPQLDYISKVSFYFQKKLTDEYNMRSQPNIIITGTPGVGKTTHCEQLAQSTGLKHLSVNDVVKERGCHDGYDEEFKSWIVDEDKVRRSAGWVGPGLGKGKLMGGL